MMHKVLVVEDDPDFGLILRQQLASGGYVCRLANSVAGALEESSQFMPDIILLDIHFAEYDASDFLQCYQLKCLEQNLPEATIIMMSAHAEKDVVDYFFRNGASGFLQKPYSKKQLLDKLRLCQPDTNTNASREILQLDVR